jgi:hypothetical protein
MQNTNTTTTKAKRRKVAKGSNSTLLPKRVKKPYSRAELAAEVYALTGRQYDAAFLCDCLAGTRKTPADLEEHGVIPKAQANLIARKLRAA